jgi:hypothetical protein
MSVRTARFLADLILAKVNSHLADLILAKVNSQNKNYILIRRRNMPDFLSIVNAVT